MYESNIILNENSYDLCDNDNDNENENENENNNNCKNIKINNFNNDLSIDSLYKVISVKIYRYLNSSLFKYTIINIHILINVSIIFNIYNYIYINIK